MRTFLNDLEILIKARLEEASHSGVIQSIVGGFALDATRDEPRGGGIMTVMWAFVWSSLG